MERQIEYGVVAAKLTFLSATSLTIFSAINTFVLVRYTELTQMYATLTAIFIAFCGMHIVIGWYFRKNYKNWNITLIKNDGRARIFAGAPFLSIMFGFYWRTMLLGYITGAIATALKNMYGDGITSADAFGITLVTLMLNLYLAFYWMLKVQYGNYKIVNLENFKKTAIEHEPIVTVEDAKSSIKDNVISGLGTLTVFSYFVIGFVQIFAGYAFFRNFCDWNWFFSTLAALFISYMPLIGSFVGVIGATKVWGWGIWSAVLLFFYPIVLWLILMFLGGSVAIFKSITKK